VRVFAYVGRRGAALRAFIANEGPPDESRDKDGKWTDGGGGGGGEVPPAPHETGGGSSGGEKTPPAKLHKNETITVDHPLQPYKVYVNPSQGQMRRMMGTADNLGNIKVVSVGDNIAAAKSDSANHHDIVQTLKDNGHPLGEAASVGYVHHEVNFDPANVPAGNHADKYVFNNQEFVVQENIAGAKTETSRIVPKSEWPLGLKRSLGQDLNARFILIIRNDGPPDEERDDSGKWTEGGGGGSREGGDKSSGGGGGEGGSIHETTKGSDGKRTNSDGSALPAHIEALKIPPAWNNVTYNSDPNANLHAEGVDVAGRRQAIYNEKFLAANAAGKFARVESLSGKMGSITQLNDANMKSPDQLTSDKAGALNLVMKMGLRPGSEDDTGAKIKAYGVTTLEGRHVVTNAQGTFLKFTGKDGVSLNLQVHDKALEADLIARSNKSGPTGQLFGNVTDKNLLGYTKTVAGKEFKVKDFRTNLGTQTALAEIKTMPVPTNEKDYKKSVMGVAKTVSTRLGNTPTIALQSYINASVFAHWRMSAGV
jgi:DNA topoisomerase-1